MLSSRMTALMSHVILNEWLYPFTVNFLFVLCYCYIAGAMWNCCCPSTHSVYIIQPCTSLQCHFISKPHNSSMHVCLAEICHSLHFLQNDQDLLRATAVKWEGGRGVNEYCNKSWHRKLTLERKIVPPLLQRLRPMTFWSQVGTGIAQWLERQTRDWKVPGSYPCRSGGRIFFSRVDFLCWL